VPSVLAQEQLDFEELVASARAARERTAQTANASARVRMFLDPELVENLRAHQVKWQFLPYHGYGRRELATLGQYLERLADRLNQPAAATDAQGKRQYAVAARARQEALCKLDLDSAHRALFEVYPEIGAAKLYRRYAQLRNFYYLDMLLAEIARRIGVNEWAIRCMLPEEVIGSLESRRPIDSAILQRSDGCLYALLGDEERIVTGSRFQELHHLIQTQLHSVPEGGVLQGQVACRGKVTGRCRVVIRADDVRADFEPGSILVSEATDPDLVGLLKKAGGVLTEQGGVTSHAAIICRELGIPTIIGIEGLLSRLHDGDLVEVDADRGLVTPLKREVEPSKDLVFASVAAHSPNAVGGKAYNLGRVRSLGFAVPAFVLLNYEGVRRALERSQGCNGSRLAEWTIEQLGLSADEKLAFRSSAVGEDSDNGSLAGEYESLLNVERQHFFSALCEFLARNRQGKREAAYRGSIIVQRMIAPACAGVCLTLDPRTGNPNAVIIEFVPGGNEAVTGGHVRPDRLIVDRRTGDILEDDRRHTQFSGIEFDVAALVPQFLTLESRFGKPLDIEWALDDRKLYILQVRPIAHLPMKPIFSHPEAPDDSIRTTG
jgi:phosphohistidine swiveling domain-containing protein